MIDKLNFTMFVTLGFSVGAVFGIWIMSEMRPINTDTYINGIHYKEINGTTVNITKDSLEMQIYKDYQKRFIQ